MGRSDWWSCTEGVPPHFTFRSYNNLKLHLSEHFAVTTLMEQLRSPLLPRLGKEKRKTTEENRLLATVPPSL